MLRVYLFEIPRFGFWIINLIGMAPNQLLSRALVVYACCKMQQAYTTNIQKASNIAATLCDSLLPYLSFLLLATLFFYS
jgi:hypothetical protein